MAKQTIGKSQRYVREDGQHRRYGRRWTAIRQIVLERDGGRCCLCGTADGPHHADHIVPFALGGGEYDLDNVWLLCEACNLRLGAKRKEPAVERMALALAAARNRAR